MNTKSYTDNSEINDSFSSAAAQHADPTPPRLNESMRRLSWTVAIDLFWEPVDNTTKNIVLNNTSNTNKGRAQTQDFCREHSGVTELSE